MHWFNDFQLVLFDFDGLLVNTEEIHYKAYQRMCAQRGITLDLGFENYCKIAHYHSEGLSEQLYRLYPDLKAQGASWDVLYLEKKQAMIDLLREGAVQVMPGVERLLLKLKDAGISRCVVTHSPKELIDMVRHQHPIFDIIPIWITREQYEKPKPNSECYIKAINLLAKAEDRVVGFEDTPRGLKALLGTRAKPVLICETHYPEIPSFIASGVAHYKTFADIPDDMPLQGK